MSDNLATLGIKVTSDDINKAIKRLDKLEGQAGKTERATDGVTAGFGRMIAPIAALVSVSAGLSKLVTTARSFEVLKASLKTVTGSAEAAAQAFEGIQSFAAKTPFDLDQVANAFIKMKSLGLDPSEAALTSYGNTASAMGKDLDQMIEAVADAATGEFERLKTFGIKAKQEGDNVSFTFQGVTTTIKKNAADIEGYLQNIGNVNFDGAMTERAKTLDGVMSNMGDNFDALFRTLADSGATDGMVAAFGAVRDALADVDALIAGGGAAMGAEAFFNQWSRAFSDVGKSAETALNETSRMMDEASTYWGVTGTDATDTISDAFLYLPENVAAFVKLVTVEIAALASKMVVYGEDIASSLNPANWFKDEDQYDPTAQLAAIDEARGQSIDSILAQIEANKALTDSERERVQVAYEAEVAARATDKGDLLATAGKSPEDIAEDEAARAKAKEAAELAHQEELLKIKKKAADEAYKLAVKEADIIALVDQQKYGDALGAAAGATAALSKHNRMAFEANKAFATGQVLVDGVMAVQKAASAYPYPFNLVGIATESLRAAGNLAAVRSASFGGGGNIPSASGGSAGGVPSEQNVTTPAPQESSQDNNERKSSTTIIFQGNVLSQDFVESEVVPIIQGLDATGDVMLISPTGRTAQEIRDAGA